MKSISWLGIFICCMLAPAFSFAQGQIMSIAPSSAVAGPTDVVIQGMGTNFQRNSTTVSFGDGIDVINVDVRDAEMLTARIQIRSSAQPGPRDVIVTTNGEQVTSYGGFQVISAGGQFNATLIVVPIQTLKVSDFDPNNLGASPVIFTVNIFNDQKERQNVVVDLTVSAQSLGKLGSGRKVIKNLSPGQFLTFNNKEFDTYQFENINSDIIQKAIQTGTLPADQYIYEIKISEGGETLADLDGSNVINNITNRPELIGPGNNFAFQAGTIFSRQPLFQWFAQASSFDFALYEVKAGQVTAEEIVLNRPLYHQEDLTTTTMLYPASAQPLEPGKVYAWQIKASYASGSGTEVMLSEVFWFTITDPGTDPTGGGGTVTTTGITTKPIAELQIEPAEAEISAGQTFKFSVKAYDANMDTISGIQPYYRVIPSTAGTVDRDGNFTAAANASGAVAVVATVGEHQDYATVEVKPSFSGASGSGAYDIEGMIKGIFGLP